MITAANEDGSTPAHRFAGCLREIDYACVRGLWQISLRLEDEAGRSQYVTLSPGRDDAGALACGLQLASLTIGHRYHGRANLHRCGDTQDYFSGRVTLASDQRRLPTLRLAACNAPPTPTGDCA